MAKWRYPGYLPKPPHEMTDFDWQSYKTGLSKEQMSERYSGITSDLIPAFEQIQAQGLGDINPDPYKRVSPFGAASENNSISEIFYPSGSARNDSSYEHLGSDLDQLNLQRSQRGTNGAQRQYGAARALIGAGKAAYDGIQKVGDFAKNVFGTKEDPTAYRLGVEWVTGSGPKERHLGPNSRIVQEFRNSEGVNIGRRKLYNEYNGVLKDGDSYVYPHTFTIPAAWRARTASEQFVGSYRLNMKVQNGLIHFEAWNLSSMESLLFGTLRSHLGLPGGPNFEDGPGSDKVQVLRWTEPVV